MIPCAEHRKWTEEYSGCLKCLGLYWKSEYDRKRQKIKELEAKTEIDKITMDNFLGRIKELEADCLNYKLVTQDQQQSIKELEEENKMLMRSLAAQPDKQNSTGAAQAQMEYQIELRNKRIEELEVALRDIRVEAQGYGSFTYIFDRATKALKEQNDEF